MPALPEQLPRLVAWTRIGIGASALLWPALLPRSLGVPAPSARQAAWLSRMVGGRDLALGLGALQALRSGSELRPWLLAQALADSADVVASVGAARRGHLSPLPAALATAAAAGGAAASLLSAARE